MNRDLISQKKELILKLSKEEFSLNYNTIIKYHGIPLRFKASSSALIDDLQSELPPNWFVHCESFTDVSVLNPLDYGFTAEDWCDEESQDCYIEENLVIHRDFAALQRDNKILLLCQQRLSDGLYNFLRWLLPKKLLERDTFVLHSCCIVSKDENANFFLGHSGAGKSTIASLAGKRKILGDDMNLIHHQKLKAYPGAIGGLFIQDVDYNDSFDISAFYWLEQSEVNEKNLMSPSQAHSKLLASVTNLFWNTLTEEEIQKIFEITFELISKIPCYQLSFKKDESFWELVDGEF